MTITKLATAIAFAVVAISFVGLHSNRVQAAADLYLQQRCEPDGTVSLAFIWEGNDQRALQQFIDVASTNEFQTASTVTAGPFPGATQHHVWTGWRPAASYYTRVTQQLPGGAWESSVVYRLELLTCGMAPPPQLPPAPQSPATSLPPLPQQPPALQQQQMPAQTSQSPNVRIVSLPPPLNRGNTAVLHASTLPNASCSLAYTEPSGVNSTTAGLGPKDADASGAVMWSWVLAISTNPGTGMVAVTCAGQTVTATIQVTS